MDQGENKIQLFGIFNELLCYIMSFGCPVCFSLSICQRLFNLFKDTAAELAGQIYMITSLDLSWRNGLPIVNRLYEFVVQSLAAEATKPVTLGDSMDNSLVNTSQSRSNPGNGNHSSNELVVHSEDSSAVPKLEEAVVEDDPDLKNGESELSLVISEENEGDEIVEEEAPETSLGTENKAPKKMVSINDNVEEIYFSKKKKKKKKSTEKVPSIKEQVKEEPKPLKSILKVALM